MQLQPRDRLIFALDVPTADEALEWVDRLEPSFGVFKIGLELFTAGGPDVVRRVVDRGQKVFLDLKLHDIPTTIERAARSVSRLGIWAVNAHAAGGRVMLEAAVCGAGSSVRVIGVTRLTSDEASEADVVALARVSQDAGCAGVVCAGSEAAAVRAELGPDAVIVCPGIRPQGGDRNDQTRVVPPSVALKSGASHVVIGRIVRDAADPEGVSRDLLRDVTQALG
ncbi:MAG: orotidine-5'-phosphate decarboxylase [Myxococcota bacterium]